MVIPAVRPQRAVCARGRAPRASYSICGRPTGPCAGGSGSQGQISDLEIHGHEVLRQRELIEGFLAHHTGRDVAKVHEDIERDRVLTAEQAREFGLVDEVVIPCSGSGVG
ncbi:ClpP family protease [Streptomyces sp. NPDC088350]|uniref:ClpP family protease n=1 Tax=Streptomyces sp. NPDC088350 TaxID=3365854 RepID=UPI00382E8CAB